MYKEFGENRSILNAVGETLVFGFIVLMMVFFVALFGAEGALGIAVFFFMSAVLLGLIGIDKIRRGYNDYPLVVTDYHIVCSFPYGNRKVLNRDRVTWFKIVKQRLILVHDGWPTVVYVRGLSEDSQKELEKLIISGNS